MKHFILMGDIIASGEKDQKQLMADFKLLIKEINQCYKQNILSPLTITLGDEFQGVIGDLDTAVNIILSIEESIIKNKLKFKLRHILNEGEIDTPINKNIAYEMLGSGLTEARHKLNDLKNERERFYISIENKIQEEIILNAFKIYESIIEKWNIERDYEIAYNFIEFHDYKIVSLKMKKNRSLIWKREKTLNMTAYHSVKKIIKTALLII